jgi:hypothetical protein
MVPLGGMVWRHGRKTNVFVYAMKTELEVSGQDSIAGILELNEFTTMMILMNISACL